MSDLVRLKRSRASCKSWLQREVQKLQTILDCNEPDVTELDMTLGEFSRRLASWDAAQSAVEAELEDGRFEEDLQAAGAFRDACMAVHLKAVKLASFVHAAAPCEGNEASSRGGSLSMKLPKIDLSLCPASAGGLF